MISNLRTRKEFAVPFKILPIKVVYQNISMPIILLNILHRDISAGSHISGEMVPYINALAFV